MQVSYKSLCILRERTNPEVCKTHFCPLPSVGMNKLLSLSSVSLPTARELLNIWSCTRQNRLMKMAKYDMHRTHLDNANKLLASLLLLPVGFTLVPLGWAWDSNAYYYYIVLHSKTLTLPVPLSPTRTAICLLLFLSEVLTRMPSAQIKQILPETGHTVRRGARGMVC